MQAHGVPIEVSLMKILGFQWSRLRNPIPIPLTSSMCWVCILRVVHRQLEFVVKFGSTEPHTDTSDMIHGLGMSSQFSGGILNGIRT